MLYVTTPMPEDVSPLEAHRERLYWLSLLAGKGTLQPELRAQLFEIERARRVRASHAAAGRIDPPRTQRNRAA
jgi:hypothetical protein